MFYLLALLQRLLTPLAIWPRLENGVLRAKPEEPDAQPVIVSVASDDRQSAGMEWTAAGSPAGYIVKYHAAPLDEVGGAEA